jgi:hypothetical protein
MTYRHETTEHAALGSIFARLLPKIDGIGKLS